MENGRLSGVMRDGMDVATGPATRDAMRHPNRFGIGADGETPLVQLALGADEADARAVVVMESRALAGHPRKYPDVDSAVLVEQLVPAPVTIDNDEWAPEVGTRGDPSHELLERRHRERAGLIEQFRGARGQPIGERGNLNGLELLSHVLVLWCREACVSYLG